MECIDGFRMSLIEWNNFVIWQCFLRQRNFRKFSGKPSEGTVAAVYGKNSNDEINSFAAKLWKSDFIMFIFSVFRKHRFGN